MVHPEITGKKRAPVAENADAYSISEFCRRHGFSPQLFYKFEDQMPPTFKIGVRRLISREAAARWRAERERATKTNNDSENPTAAASRQGRSKPSCSSKKSDR